jgi:ATP-dependent helicase/nuclease subunit B
VILSHAAKIAGSPDCALALFAAPCRHCRCARWQAALDRGNVYLEWARALDRPERVVPAPQPAPKPPRAARPKRLSVTDIENWLRDPYTIYAKYVLRLAPLDPVDMSPGAAERGTIIHAAIGDFTERFAARLPADPARELIEMGRPHFAALEDFPEARAFWWPRFQRIAQWFADWEATAPSGYPWLTAEIRGEIEFRLPKGMFKLAALPTASSATGRRPLRHPRLQDRVGAHRKASAHRACAAAHARSGDPAPMADSPASRAAPRSRRWVTCCSKAGRGRAK